MTKTGIARNPMLKIPKISARRTPRSAEIAPPSRFSRSLRRLACSSHRLISSLSTFIPTASTSDRVAGGTVVVMRSRAPHNFPVLMQEGTRCRAGARKPHDYLCELGAKNPINADEQSTKGSGLEDQVSPCPEVLDEEGIVRRHGYNETLGPTPAGMRVCISGGDDSAP